MSSGVLMDTNALIWFASGEPMSSHALVAITEAQRTNQIYVSPISAWEASLAARKMRNRPNLGGRDPDQWFAAILAIRGVKPVFLSRRIALEAAKVPAIYGDGDPGDCFLIATARVKRVPIVTRDAAMIGLSEVDARFLKTIQC